jgi:ABC-type branched-subunit amino acid transport system ATPase component
VNLDLQPDERHAFFGPNGAGKSTVFHLISGNLAPTSGEIVFNGQRIDGRTPQEVNRLGLSRSFQITNIFPRLTVFEPDPGKAVARDRDAGRGARDAGAEGQGGCHVLSG